MTVIDATADSVTLNDLDAHGDRERRCRAYWSSACWRLNNIVLDRVIFDLVNGNYFFSAVNEDVGLVVAMLERKTNIIK